MGYLEQDEVSTYRRMYTLLGVGGGIFLFGFLILVFGRTYGFDGSHYDLFMVFGIIFVIIGLGIVAYPLAVQIKILLKGLRRQDDLEPGYGFPAPSAAGQVMRNTQIFSSAPPSTYGGGGGGLIQQQQYQQQQFQAQQQQQQYQAQTLQAQQQQYQPQFQQRGPSYNPQGPHQFSSAAAAMYRAASNDQLGGGIKPAYSQSSLSRQAMPPPAYDSQQQRPQVPPQPITTKPQISRTSDI